MAMQHSSLTLLAVPMLSILIIALLLINPVQASAPQNVVTQGEWKIGYIRVVTSPIGTHDATIRYKLSSGEIGFPYKDKNGKAQVERDVIWADPWFHGLSLNIISNSSGTLTLELPRSVIDSRMVGENNNNSTTKNDDAPPLTAFFRYPTGIVPATIHELNKTSDMRLVSIDFPVLPSDYGYNIGIRGTSVIPEFDGMAPPPAALALSLVSMLYLTIRFNRRFNSKKQSRYNNSPN